MKKLYRLKITILFALFLIFCGSSIKAQAYRILPLGNSITEGYDASVPPEGDRIAYRKVFFNQLTSAGHSIELVGHNNTGYDLMSDADHGGIPGSRAQYVTRLLQDGYDLRWSEQITDDGAPYLEENPADIILIHVGTNDITHGEGTSAADMSDILDEIDAWEVSSGTHVAVFVARIILRTDDSSDSAATVELNDNVASMIAGRGDPSIFMVNQETGAGIDYETEMLADGIHPTQSGYDKMGQRWYTSVNAYLNAIPASPVSLALSGETFNSIDLAWADNSSNETGFQIERSTSPDGGSFTLIHTADPEETTYTDGSLADNTHYYYRVRAINATGPSLYTLIEDTYTLTSPPADPTGLSASADDHESISLTWDDIATDEDGYSVERSESSGTGYDEIDQIPGNSKSYTDNGLEDGKQYYYRVRAFKGTVFSGYSNEASAITDLEAPTDLTATALGETSIQLNWSDNSVNETGYRIERRLLPGGTYGLVTTSGVDANSYTDVGRTEGTTYEYRVRANGTGDPSAWSNEAGATTKPDAPSGLTAAALGETSIQLDWDDNSDNETGFRIERRISGGSFSLVTTITDDDVTTYTDGGRTEGTTYEYKVRATDDGDPSDWSNVAGVTTKPDAPSDLTATALGETSIQLNWSDNSDNETGFRIDRRISGGSFEEVTTITDDDVITYTDGGRTLGIEYFYRVRATDTGDPSDWSNVASATTKPAAPTGLTATALDEESIQLNWDDNSDNETGFRIERRVPGGSFVLVTTITDDDVTTYTDGGRTEGTTYEYRVLATSTGDPSDWSNVAGATTKPNAPSGLTATALGEISIQLDWDDNSDNETGFRIERRISGGSFGLVTTITDDDVTTYTDGGRTEGTTYEYRVRATDDGDPSDWSNVATATTKPDAPSDLTATALGETSIQLNWSDNSDNETGFRIDRRISGGSFAEVTTITGDDVTTYTDGGRTVGVEYFYRVRATGAGDPSDWSNEASATTGLPDPSDLTATTIDSVSIQLDWSDNSASETGFLIERSESSGTTGFSEVTTVGADITTYADEGLTDGTRYYYRIQAVAGGTSSGYSNVDDAITDLSSPTNLTAIKLGTSSIKLQWDDISDSETGYRVQRSLSSGTGFVTIKDDLPKNTSSYNDTGLEDATEYFYRVQALGTYGNSNFSNEASAITDLAPPDAPDKFEGNATSTCEVQLKWRDNSENEAGFELKRSLLPTSGFEVLQILPAETTLFTDTTTLNHTPYYYRLMAFNAAGRSDSAAATVLVSYDLEGGVIDASQTICPAGDPDPLISLVPPTGGSNNWTYQWQSRILPGAFTDIPDATGISYNPPLGLLEVTDFQRISTVECGSAISNILTITPEDLENPEFTSCPAYLDLEIERYLSDTLFSTEDPAFTDNCGVVLLTWSMSGAIVDSSPGTGINYLGDVRFPLGTTTIAYHAEDITENSAECEFQISVKIKDPEIQDVSIPNNPDNIMGIGSIVPVTITVAHDGGTEYELVSGSIGGYPVTGLYRQNATTYLANIEIVEGGNSYLPEQNIPVSNLVLTDGFVQSQPYNLPIIQPNDWLDAQLPVIYSMSAVPGDYKIGDQVIVNISSDGIGYTIQQSSRINGILVTRPNVMFEETGAGNYRLIYTVEEGDQDVDRGELAVSVALIKPSGNVDLPFTEVTNVELVSIDAHAPVIYKMEVPSIEVGVGRTVQVTITSDEEGYDAATGTIINGVPIGSPRVTFSEIGSGLYELSYVVQQVDNVVSDGDLEMTLVLRDSAGNVSLPYSRLEPNLLEIYTDVPIVFLTGTSEVCEDNSANLVAFLSGGRNPWSIDLYDGTDTTTYGNINSEEYQFSVIPKGSTTYRIIRINDVNGVENTGSEDHEVTVNPKTEVEIINLPSAFSVEDDPVQLEASVPGGDFTGPGVFTAGGIFDPGKADTVDSPHIIIYEYENENGCISVDSALVFVLGANADIFIPNPLVCDYSDPFIVSASNVAGDMGSFTLLNPNGQTVAGLTDHGDNTASIDPALLAPEIYTIEYTYFDGVILHYRESFIVESVQTPNITSPVQLTYCQNNEPVALKSNVSDAVFSGPGVTGNISSGFMFDPGQGNLGINSIICTATTENGCSQSTQIEINVLFTPEVLFSLSSSCIGQHGGEIAFSNLTPGKILVESWNWDFGDPGSGELNSSNLVEPRHFYDASGEISISLSVATTDGCVDEYVLDTMIGILPVAQFNWITDCYEDGVESLFLNKSIAGSADLDSLHWTFRDSNGSIVNEFGTTSPEDTVKYQFDGTDIYNVDLYVRNEDGCSMTTTDEIELRPTIALEDAEYNEEFNMNDGLWTIHSDSLEISWTWDTPDFTGFIQDPEDKAWFTQFPEDVLIYDEKSWVQSPCFNFSGTDAPMISLDLMRSFIPDFTDGAVLQYQDVIEEGWKTVGDVSTGIQWYNSATIEKRPGGSSTGWGLGVFNPDTEWITARHGLEELKDRPYVSFRIAIATNGAQGIGNQGFAFDNVIIGERTKRVVLEHFTNSSDEVSKEADDIIDNFGKQYPNNVIDIQYHMDYPGFDPMNENNPDPPEDRGDVFYGVPEIPYAVLDGGITPEQRFTFEQMTSSSIGNQINMSTLEIPPFDIDLEVDWLETGLIATTTVTCLTDRFENYVHLYALVYEREVTAYSGINGDKQFRNVVLDMLPSAAGTLLRNNWTEGNSEVLTNEWTFKPYVEDIEDLAVAVFIQERGAEMGKVLQAAVEYKNGLVGTWDRQTEMFDLTTYPNPARHEFYINLGDRAKHDGTIELINMNGQVVQNALVPNGYQIIQVNIEHLNPGIYLVRWTESKDLRGIGKIVKSR